MKLEAGEMSSPIGMVGWVAGESGLCALDFAVRRDTTRAWLGRRFGDVSIVSPGGSGSPGRSIGRRLQAYFDGDLTALDDLEVDPGGTAFQQRVWAALRRIEPGRTASYGEVAAAIGRPTAVRAVGAANGSNPIAIVIPCHRVIGADGRLTGYGGGLHRKRWLLDHEREHALAALENGLARAATT